MNIYHYGLDYNERMKRIELANYGVFAEPDATYSPEWLCSFLYGRMRLNRAQLDRDILVSLNCKGRVSSLYFVQNGAQTYGLFSQRLTLLYALLSFCEAFVFVHYKADAPCAPTNEDGSTCRALNKAFSALSLKLYDFLLIGMDGWHSFRMQGKNAPHCQDDAATAIPTKNSDRAA